MNDLTPAKINIIETCFRKFYGANRSKITHVITQADFIQECWVKFLRGKYDESRSGPVTFAYLIAKHQYCRLLEVYYGKRSPDPVTESVADISEIRTGLFTQPDLSDVYRAEHKAILKNITYGKAQIPAVFLYDLLESEGGIDAMHTKLKDHFNINISRRQMECWIYELRRRLKANRKYGIMDYA